jgi:hypothetical protein
MLPVISALLACIAGFFRVQDLVALDFFTVPTYHTHSALQMDSPWRARCNRPSAALCGKCQKWVGCTITMGSERSDEMSPNLRVYDHDGFSGPRVSSEGGPVQWESVPPG